MEIFERFFSVLGRMKGKIERIIKLGKCVVFYSVYFLYRVVILLFF